MLIKSNSREAWSRFVEDSNLRCQPAGNIGLGRQWPLDPSPRPEAQNSKNEPGHMQALGGEAPCGM